MKFAVPSNRQLTALFLATFLVLAASAFFMPSSAAALGFQPVVPEELKMTSEPLAPGAAAVILYRQVDRFDDIKLGREENYLRIKILKEEGRKYADIEIPSFNNGGSIVGVKGRTIKPDGTIVNFDGKVFEKNIVKARGAKYKAKTFTLPDVQVGSVIEYMYVEDMPEYSLYDSHWVLSQELFTKKAKFSLKPVTSYYDMRFFVRWTWNSLPAGTVAPKEGPDGIIRMDTQNIPAFITEDYMPPENELKSRVDFVYDDQPFERDMEKFWKNKGKKMNGKMEDFVGKRKVMEQAIAEIVQPSDSPEMKLQKIYARVQKMRNTSFEVSKTEQEVKREKRKDNNNVEDLWKRGYGNGVELTWLYLALVRAAGFEAYGVWASDRYNYFFKPGTMEDNKLNSNVVLVKLNGKELFLDPGAAFTPFGLLPWSETGVVGLRMDKEGGGWITTSLPESSASGSQRKANLKLSAETGDLEGTVSLTLRGLDARRYRIEERNADETERKKVLEDMLKDSIPAAAEIELTNKPDWTSSDPSLVAEFKVKIPGWASSAGRRALLSAGLFSGTEKRVFDHAERVHPVYFEYPFEKNDDITIELPEGWKISNLPQPRNEDVRVVGYSMKADSPKDGVLHLERKLRIDVLLLEQKNYGAIREFFQIVRTGDEGQVVLQPGTAISSK